jgi:exopolysaccharide biosynthesis polyprenyl glycosylphosphotransferase
VEVSQDTQARTRSGSLTFPSGPRPRTETVAVSRWAPIGRRRRTVDRARRYRRFLAAADAVAASVTLALASSWIGGEAKLAVLLIAGLALVLVIAKTLGLYDRDPLVLHKSTLEEGSKLFELSTLFCFALLIGGASLQAGEPGALMMVAIWATLFLGLLAARVAARALARATTAPERCMLLGDPVVCRHVRHKIASCPTVNATVVCEVLSERIGQEELPPAKLAELARRYAVERVVIAARSTDHADVLNLVRSTAALGLDVSVVPRLLEVVGSSTVVDDVDGLRVLGVRRFGMTRSSWFLKRAFDVCGSAAGLVLLAPLLAVIALAIRLTSPGPVLFRQLRVGRGERVFCMLKFRTMVEDAELQKASLAHLNEAPGLFKISDDPRVTKVGGYLRRTALDELPQLWNVLKGEMSLVGPRPLVIEDDSHIQGWHRRRLDLTPGMTGPWQVLGSSRIPLGEMLKLDYLYVSTWSLWGDIKILVRTLAFVVVRRIV